MINTIAKGLLISVVLAFFAYNISEEITINLGIENKKEKLEPLHCRWYSMQFLVTEYVDDRERQIIVDTERGRIFEYMQCAKYDGLASNNIGLGRNEY